MTSRDIIDASVSYIENNLSESLNVEMLAAKAGFSTYHFCKLFVLYKGIPVMEYIRRRRLVRAIPDICNKKRIVDVAIDHGFESHNGFAKAFKKIYGVSPDEFRKRTTNHRPFPPNPLANLSKVNASTVPSCKIEYRDAFYIAGTLLQTSDDLTSISRIPALWQVFDLHEIEHRLYALASPEEHGEYYISIPSDNGDYELFSGVKVQSLDKVDKSLRGQKVPAALYAIISTPPCFGTSTDFSETIIKTWEYIFNDWLPHSGYALDSSGLDFEFYDERCHSSPYSMDIYLAIKKL